MILFLGMDLQLEPQVCLEKTQVIMKKTTLLINCPDRKGIIATVTNFILAKKGNTIYIEQHVDRELKEFFMRLECEFDEDAVLLKPSYILCLTSFLILYFRDTFMICIGHILKKKEYHEIFITSVTAFWRICTF